MHGYNKDSIAALKGGQGQSLFGDGGLVVLKALLESGISYFGGYPGAPTANLMDAVADAYAPVLKEMGVHVESSSNEMAAAAMMTASTVAPVRGAVTWKVLGNGVATDVLDHVAQIGVLGGALIVVGEDYGLSSTTVAQRTPAWAMKSAIPVIDPRGDMQRLHQLVKDSLELSEASKLPVAFLLRPQMSHMNTTITVGDNVAGTINEAARVAEIVKDAGRYPLAPNNHRQDVERYTERLPAAIAFARRHDINERFGNSNAKIGLITHGLTYNTARQCLAELDLLDPVTDEVDPRFDWLQLNMVYPIDDEAIVDFLNDKDAVLLIEEGQPETIEEHIRSLMQRNGLPANFFGHDFVPALRELTPERLLPALERFLMDKTDFVRSFGDGGMVSDHLTETVRMARGLFPEPPPPRLPTFCTGCPERPVFSQMKIKEDKTGTSDFKASDVGCYGMAGFAPFNMADSNMGMGAGLASGSTVGAMTKQKITSVVGDGTFWHSALNTGVVNGLHNHQDATLIVLDNAWTAMTGHHENPGKDHTMAGVRSSVPLNIKRTLKSLGIKNVAKVNPYHFRKYRKSLDRLESKGKGELRVLISEAECQLAKQRRVKQENRNALQAGHPVTTKRFGVDPEVCVGDHACMRYNGCPSLTLRPAKDILRSTEHAHVDQTCVGCGTCGEVAHTAELCPSFFEVTKTDNPGLWARVRSSVRKLFVPAL